MGSFALFDCISSYDKTTIGNWFLSFDETFLSSAISNLNVLWWTSSVVNFDLDVDSLLTNKVPAFDCVNTSIVSAQVCFLQAAADVVSFNFESWTGAKLFIVEIP